ncbi:hypothetical protein ACLBXM_15640 [Xanthobacteraceae bacterium A53D]
MGTRPNRIHLTTVIGGFVKVFPFMIAHYRELGIQSLMVNVHLAAPDDPAGEMITRAAQALDCPIASQWVGDWQAVSRTMYQESRAAYPDDWFVIADQDELQHYPDDLVDVLRWCDRRGYDYVRGCFVDRLARDGGLGELREDLPIWSQFPLAGQISQPIGGADPRKVVAAKGHVRLAHGQHAALSGQGCPAEEIFVQVHHFKWTEGLHAHLSERAALLRKGNHSHWVDSANLLEHLDYHGGRFDLSRPDLMIAECERDYPYWEQVRDAVLEYERKDSKYSDL